MRKVAVFDTNILLSVTGDHRHLLPMGAFHGIAIVTAADFVAAVANP
jgi:acyl-coenzyme A thioesterase PaaI-like protein